MKSDVACRRASFEMHVLLQARIDIVQCRYWVCISMGRRCCSKRENIHLRVNRAEINGKPQVELRLREHREGLGREERFWEANIRVDDDAHSFQGTERSVYRDIVSRARGCSSMHIVISVVWNRVSFF
jgi:hypothetical protein